MALITALLIVSLATIAVVSMTATQRLHVRYLENHIQRDQAWHYALGGEVWAKGLLADDARKDQVDTLDEKWATEMTPIQVEGGTVWGRLEDLQSRFNLNSLIVDGKQDVVFMEIFERLLQHLDLDVGLASAVADWMDADSEPGGSYGVENPVYAALEMPYRAADRPMVSVTELRLIQGFDEKVVKVLMPYVTVLPGSTPININTASAMVLSALADNITFGDASEVERTRRGVPFKSLGAFLTHSNLVQALEGLKKLTERNFSVTSDYFRLTSRAELGRGRMILQSEFRRKGDKVAVIGRSLGGG